MKRFALLCAIVLLSTDVAGQVLVPILLRVPGVASEPAAFTHIASGGAAASGADSTTSGNVDTTGADLLVVGCSGYTGDSATITVSDSEGNTWAARTLRDSGEGAGVRHFDVIGPMTSATHTFTCSLTGGYSTLTYLVASATGSIAFDTQTGTAGEGVTSAQPGSITPSEDASLLVSAVSTASHTHEINSSFTEFHDTSWVLTTATGAAGAYRILSAAAAQNPTWSWDASSVHAVSMVAYVIGEGGGMALDFGGYRAHYQGYGYDTLGGAGGEGRTCTVNTLTVSGTPTWGTTGDVRDCLEGLPAECSGPGDTRADCQRYVLFEVSGASEGGFIRITGPYLTIAGQTAPGGSEGTGDSGVGGFWLHETELYIDTHNVVMQHIGIRGGDSGSLGCAISIGDGGDAGDNSHVYAVTLDHVSVAWADHYSLCVAYNGASNRMQIVDSLFAEPFYNPNGLNAFAAAPHADCTQSYARNIQAHGWGRNPNLSGGQCTVAAWNNLTYNGSDDIAGQFMLVDANHGDWGALSAVFAGNMTIAGPESGTPSGWLLLSLSAATVMAGAEVYLIDNTGFGITGATGNGQWDGVFAADYSSGGYTQTATGGASSNVRVDALPAWATAFDFQVIPTAGNVARDAVMDNAGARPVERDAVDTRIIADVLANDGTHEIDATVISGYGGLPTIAARTRSVSWPMDADDPGACGNYSVSGTPTPRTVGMCFLESDASFGAQRVENLYTP